MYFQQQALILYMLISFSCESLHHLTAGSDVTLSVLPFYHLWAQLTSIGYCLMHGTTNIVYHRFNIDLFIQGIQEHQVS